MELPSVRYGPDDPKPIGFVDEVTTAHLVEAQKVLDDLARAVSAGRPDDVALDVRIASVRHAPPLPIVLYGFHVLNIDEAGKMQDEVSPDRPITYALVANHGAEVQREAALLFLYQLVYRQSGLRNVMHGSDSDRASRIARAAVEADARAERTFLDRSLGGWRKATDALALEAAELVWFVNEPVL